MTFVWAAPWPLADPTRRRLVARLREHEGLSVSQLARPFPISLPAVMKHLDVLSGAGLISRSKAREPR